MAYLLNIGSGGWHSPYADIAGLKMVKATLFFLNSQFLVLVHCSGGGGAKQLYTYEWGAAASKIESIYSRRVETNLLVVKKNVGPRRPVSQLYQRKNKFYETYIGPIFCLSTYIGPIFCLSYGSFSLMYGSCFVLKYFLNGHLSISNWKQWIKKSMMLVSS